MTRYRMSNISFLFIVYKVAEGIKCEIGLWREFVVKIPRRVLRLDTLYVTISYELNHPFDPKRSSFAPISFNLMCSLQCPFYVIIPFVTLFLEPVPFLLVVSD